MSGVEWRPVVGYEGSYEITADGRVRSLDRRVPHYCGGTRRLLGRQLRWVVRADGYPDVSLYRPGQKGRVKRVHRLVLEAFVGPCPDGHEALHGDGDAGNPSLSNLRWGTKLENAQDSIRHGTHVGLDRQVCPRGHSLIEPNLVRSQLARGWRHCRSCHQARRYPQLDLQMESDRRFNLIMAGTTAGAGRLAAGRIPAQRSAQPGADPARDNPATSTAPTGGATS